jgi:DNA polymerase-1
VRCRPCEPDHDTGRLHDREPTRDELSHCAAYNQFALQKNGGAAVLHLVFGRVAARQLLGPEYDPDLPFLWSEKLAAWVALLDHPSYFLHGAPKWRLEQFRQRLAQAVEKLRHPGRWESIDKQDCRLARLEDLEALHRKARQSGERIAVDIEDTAGEDFRRKILCIGFCLDGRTAYVVPVGHPEAKRSPKLVRKAVEILEDASVKKALQYGCYDADSLQEGLGCRLRGYDFDTQHAHYLYEPHKRAHGLEVIASQSYFEFVGWKDLVKENYSQLDKVPLPKLVRYNGIDCILTKRIEKDLRGKVPAPLVEMYSYAGRTLYRMEKVGPYLDREELKQLKPRIRKLAKARAEELKRLAGDPAFNPGSFRGIAVLLYDKLRLSTESGTRSTSNEVLSVLYQQTSHPVIPIVLQYREYSKILSTYITNYERSANLNEGQVRTRWFLTGAVTGRLRSGGGEEKGRINMQNLHGDKHLQNLLVSDLEWRSVAKWSPGEPLGDLERLSVFLALDYSQIEIRMLAECSGDPLLTQQFREGLDIHCAVGHALNPKWKPEQIKQNKQLRTFIKNCHFGMVYGLDPGGLYYYLQTKGVKTTQREVEDFVKRYFKRYKGVAEFIEAQRAQAQKQGYVETIFGFRRFIGEEYDEDRKTNPMNQAVNSPIQGAAHTLLLNALALLSRKPATYKVLGTPLMEVHDAIVFSVELGRLPEAWRTAKKLLEEDVPAECERLFKRKLSVPLLSEAEAGFRYGTKVELPDVPEVPRFLERWLEANRKAQEEAEKAYKEA